MDRGAWRATVHGVAESDMTEQQTLSLFTSKLNIEPLEATFWPLDSLMA